ncbi:MAG: hypothetical protein IPM29_05985 [Planctomycetes bacterium]|nr:hypothetical protein [Planctomycetota bacterium]
MALFGAAQAIVGQGTPEAAWWFEQHRERLLLDDDGVGDLLRVPQRYIRLFPEEFGAPSVVRRATGHFAKDRCRPRCATFIAVGPPIGSRHVESVAKNIVAHRLKRSGMQRSTAGRQRVLGLRTLAEDGRRDPAWQRCVDQRAA